MNHVSYEERVQAQIEQYANTINMHELPDIFHFWSHNYIAPGLKHVFGTSNIDDAYARAFVEASHHNKNVSRILSVGCGDGSVEIRVAQNLLGRGLTNFQFVCADISPILLRNLTGAIEREGLTHYFVPLQADLNKIEIDGCFDMIMANHALHHIEGLERLFEYSVKHLAPHGIFATCDVIGRNGHLRWPETAAVLTALWPMLRTEQRFHAQLKRVSDQFIDHDCSNEGFEGIRAQNILPLLLKYMKPYKFFAAGGFIDLIVDRGFGHGYDVGREDDVRFIRFLAELNEIMLDAGTVKPTWMMAYFTAEDRGETYYRDRRAITCVRSTDVDPPWVRFYPPPDHT